MSPQAKKQDLLYVSDDGNYRVYVYTYPGAKLVGTLDTAYGSPAGMCVDGAGHIFVAEYNYNEILASRLAVRLTVKPGISPSATRSVRAAAMAM
jgi:sugar lactone lactonase YvrE